MNQARTQAHCYKDRRIFFSALSLVLVLFAAYVYFVSAAVAHVVVRKELSQEITDMQTKISGLEAEYIIAKDGVGLDMALERGFTVKEDKVFVARKADAVALSSRPRQD
jgi:hypothetical protein